MYGCEEMVIDKIQKENFIITHSGLSWSFIIQLIASSVEYIPEL
jgi:hypothetical protein